MSGSDYVTCRIDGTVPIAKLCRALASHGLVLSNRPDGYLWLHEGPSPEPGLGEIKSDPPAVAVIRPRVFRTEWWRR